LIQYLGKSSEQQEFCAPHQSKAFFYIFSWEYYIRKRVGCQEIFLGSLKNSS
jgi:hypothetical protein